ncbi:hypothetical protein PUW79_02660 [Microbacterium sp. NE2HP2]|uniref:hypothetical protein n=1 Tax=Microbacterium plantarum TaxID=1816425 RepID=UPI002366ECD6|nr:hypothetical protein [Microbacterium plantarum]MDD7943526.1 hypothetical protein [Microbacterium plantarum]
MTNPAWVLHGIYSRWRETVDAANQPLNGVLDINSVEAAHELATAARALARMDELLTQFEASGRSVGLYRRQYPEWWKGLVAYDYGWGQNLNGEMVMTQVLMDEIEGFAHFLDGKVVVMSPGAKEGLRQILADARDALEVDEHLSPELRAYISRLLHQIQIALDEEAIGATFDYAEAVQNLYVAFKAASGENTDKSGLWNNLLTNILPTGVVAAMIEAGSVLSQLAIGR